MVPRRVAALLSVSAVLSSSGSVLAESPSALAVATIARASFSGPDEEGRRPLPLAPLTDEGASRPREAHTAKPLQVGALAGVGFPNLMSLGVTARVLGVVGLGANMGRLPETDVPIYGQATVAYRSWDAYARVYPIAGLFFGAGLGRHTITGTASRSFDVPYAAELGVPSTLGVSTRAEVSVLVATPHAGYLHTFGSGFTLAAEVGAAVPLGTSDVSVSTALPDGTPPEARAVIEQEQIVAMKKLGATVLPSISLRMGWMF